MGASSAPARLFVCSLSLSQILSLAPVVSFSTVARPSGSSALWSSNKSDDAAPSSPSPVLSRRQAILAVPSVGLALSALVPAPAYASTATTAENIGGNLPDLPGEAVRSYLQYRIPLAIAIDFFVFELQDKIEVIDDWGEINVLFQQSSANGGMGNPSRVEREYVNPMRILGFSMPPDEAEDMQKAQQIFESGMSKLGKATKGIRRDIPVEVTDADIQKAREGYEKSRIGLNAFIVALNKATGLNEMKTIPPRGPKQIAQYGRSRSKYNVLVKKTKLCQNRGGPTLAKTWGGLMVTGYLQDSCGIPDLDLYFLQ
mmetsp:Transcript_31882/g.63158  ORF Transcript_31882/g.63158 Transcript_31882/m.63158 type:complete len:314 (-) Transcript_31882:155-1096(-)